jgi:hypothetical protein
LIISLILSRVENKTEFCHRTGQSVLDRVARFSLVQQAKSGKNIPNCRKIHKMSIKLIKWLYNTPNALKIGIPTYSIARPFRIDPNLDFWFENLPSVNPGSGNHNKTSD